MDDNTLSSLKILVKNGQRKEALQLFESIVERNVEHYNQMIKNSNNLNESNQFLNDMIVNNRKPNEYTLTYLLNNYIKLDHVEEVHNLFDIMERRYGVKANRVHFSVVINAYVKKQQMDLAEMTFNQMREKFIKPDLISFDILIRGYMALDDLEQAQRTYQRMIQFGIKPTKTHYNYYLENHVTSET